MKSKLVSKNPILRFKLGKSIIKALGGTKFGNRTESIELSGPNGKRMLVTYNPYAKHWYDVNTKEVLPKGYTTPDGFKIDGDYAIVANLKNKLGYIRLNITTSVTPKQASPLQLKSLSLYIKDSKSMIRNSNNNMSTTKTIPFWTPKVTLKISNVEQPPKNVEQPPKKESKRIPTKNTSTVTPPLSTITPSPSLSTVLFIPGILNNGQFTPTGETTTLFDKTSLIPLFTPKPLETFGPGTFNTNVTYNSGNIRANRGVNYSNVNEYWDYLNNNKDSNDYKLFLNIMRTTDGNLNRDVFDLIMTKYGITGNLGRRDSGRLANLLNDLNLIGTEGSDARNSFIDSYNNHFNLALKEVPTKKWVPQGQDWRSNLLNVLSLSYRKKGGTLSSRNPITRFKNGGVLKFQNAGSLPTAPKAEDRYKDSYKSWNWPQYKEVTAGSILFPGARISLTIEGSDTTYTETPSRSPFVKVVPRVAKNNAKTIKWRDLITGETYPKVNRGNSPEYETLKRRFNTAWNLAK